MWLCGCFFFFKQKTAYEMRISDWSSDVCSSDLAEERGAAARRRPASEKGARRHRHGLPALQPVSPYDGAAELHGGAGARPGDAQGRGAGTGGGTPDHGRARRQDGPGPEQALGRSAAARRERPGATSKERREGKEGGSRWESG